MHVHDGTSEMLTCVNGKPRKFHEGSNEIPACQLGAELHGRNLLAENDVASENCKDHMPC